MLTLEYLPGQPAELSCMWQFTISCAVSCTLFHVLFAVSSAAANSHNTHSLHHVYVQCPAGIKITDMPRLEAAGVATDLVARRATEAYLMQVRSNVAGLRKLSWLYVPAGGV